MSDVLNNKGHIPNVGASSPSYPYSRYIVWHMMLRPDGFGKDKYIAVVFKYLVDIKLTLRTWTDECHIATQNIVELG